MRVPQNGGVGTGRSAATSERSGTTTGFSVALRFSAIAWLRSWRALRSAAFSRSATASGESGSGASPRLRVMIGSINRRPSNASRA